MSALQPPDLLQVRTADNVGIGFPTAGIGSRFLAVLIDAAFQATLILAAVLGYTALASSAGSGAATTTVGLIVLSLVALLSYAAYFVVLEATGAGRTPGKRALGLRVIRLDGSAPGLSEALVRNLVRIVDMIPPIGLPVMFLSPQSRRLGDLAAGTLVVRERPEVPLGAVAPPVLLRTPDAGPAIDGLERLGEREHAVLRAFLTRPGLSAEQRTRVAAEMAARLHERLGLSPGAPERQWPAELFLERLFLQLTARLEGRS